MLLFFTVNTRKILSKTFHTSPHLWIKYKAQTYIYKISYFFVAFCHLPIYDHLIWRMKLILATIFVLYWSWYLSKIPNTEVQHISWEFLKNDFLWIPSFVNWWSFDCVNVILWSIVQDLSSSRNKYLNECYNTLPTVQSSIEPSVLFCACHFENYH